MDKDLNGITRIVESKIEKAKPIYDRIMEVEEYEDFLLDRLPEEEAELLRLYRKLSEEEQDEVFRFVYNKSHKS